MVNLFTDDIWPNNTIQDSIKNWVSSLPSLKKNDYSSLISDKKNVDCSSKKSSIYNTVVFKPFIGKINTCSILNAAP